uniref:Uncharacterized protein n=1 Tax=Leptospira ellisii TaxID=2023197 RepID=A0A2N0B5S4_9LEPT|nr:hypothetical protein CH379_16040 [Leptospira ellisii]
MNGFGIGIRPLIPKKEDSIPPRNEDVSRSNSSKHSFRFGKNRFDRTKVQTHVDESVPIDRREFCLQIAE